MKRRAFLASALAALAPRARAADYPLVQLGHALEFPRDHGAHPQFRTEWWYVTGSLRAGAGRELGFQVTFFGAVRVLPKAIEAALRHANWCLLMPQLPIRERVG